MPPIERRLLLGGGLAAAALLRWPVGSRAAASAENPFGLGVASGCPRPSSVVIWTRLVFPEAAASTADPFAPAAAVEQPPLDVEWLVAADEGFGRIVRSGTFRATADLAHSVHIDVEGLEAGRWYFYKFRCGNAESPAGRTRTAPLGAQDFRFAFASCQQYEQGFYAAYRDMAARDLDLVVHLGDYIYEKSWGSQHVRKHNSGTPSLLFEFRDRYALYKSDPDLQAAHAAFPWLTVWDDHEVVNNYAGDVAPDVPDAQEFQRRRRAAYQAWFEHMPVSPKLAGAFDSLRIYDHYRFGDLLGITLLDARQYRSPELTADAGGDRPDRTMLGQDQEEWLAATLKGSTAKWSVLAQQTLLSERDVEAGSGTGYNLDGWDGYRAARGRLLDAVEAAKTSNPVIIGGDLHAFFAADVKRDFADPSARPVATEFVCGSITSDGPSETSLATALAENPHLKAASAHHGYAVMTLSERSARVDFAAVADRKKQDSSTSVFQSFAIVDGLPGVNLL